MKSGSERKYLFWMNKHRHALKKYAGLWVEIKLGKGIVAFGKNLKKVRQDFLKNYPGENPHLLQVPSCESLLSI